MIDTEEIELLKQCEAYFEFYPEEDEEGFDGKHYGGIKGIRSDAPESARIAYEKLCVIWEERERLGIKV